MDHRIKLQPFVGLCLATMVVCSFAGCFSSTVGGEAYDPFASSVEKEDRFVEVPLGTYFIAYPKLETGTTTVLNAKLVGVVPTRHKTEFLRAFLQRRQVMRSNVREVLQEFDVGDQSAFVIDQLKTDLVSTIRRSLQTDFIEEIVFTDFSVE